MKVDRNRSGPLRSKASSEVTCCQPCADLAEHHGVGNEYVVEDHLVEVVRAVHRDDRADLDARARAGPR